MEQRAEGTFHIWREPFTSLRMPKIFNLRTNPSERADITSNTYYDWLGGSPLPVPERQGEVVEFLKTFVVRAPIIADATAPLAPGRDQIGADHDHVECLHRHRREPYGRSPCGCLAILYLMTSITAAVITAVETPNIRMPLAASSGPSRRQRSDMTISP